MGFDDGVVFLGKNQSYLHSYPFQNLILQMFALIDCNNFYASCERVFQPQYEGKAMVILSNNDGCVIARSNEAKALGIPMGALHLSFETNSKSTTSRFFLPIIPSTET